MVYRVYILLGVNSQQDFVYTSNLNLDLRERITKSMQKHRYYVETQFGENRGKKRETSLFSNDYNGFHRGRNSVYG